MNAVDLPLIGDMFGLAATIATMAITTSGFPADGIVRRRITSAGLLIAGGITGTTMKWKKVTGGKLRVK
jgi:hypothetical protein